MGRMIHKAVSDPTSNSQLETRNFLWDNWNIISESSVSATPNSSLLTTNSFSYVWGVDLSGSLQGAGGVGGLLAVIRDDGVFAPTYDANGNVSEYVVLETSNSQLETAAIAAHYEYDAFGNTVVKSGDLADSFTFRFSTKYWENETGLLHYEKRPIRPDIGHWINRDPIGERGGLNLYGFVGNNPVNKWDYLGLDNYGSGGQNMTYTVTFPLYPIPDPSTQMPIVEPNQPSVAGAFLQGLVDGFKMAFQKEYLKCQYACSLDVFINNAIPWIPVEFTPGDLLYNYSGNSSGGGEIQLDVALDVVDYLFESNFHALGGNAKIDKLTDKLGREGSKLGDRHRKSMEKALEQTNKAKDSVHKVKRLTGFLQIALAIKGYWECYDKYCNDCLEW
jgi:RHS repeat-associated protein